MATRPGQQDPNHLRMHQRFMEAVNRGDTEKVRKFLQDPKIDVNFIEDGTGSLRPCTSRRRATPRRFCACWSQPAAAGSTSRMERGGSAARLAMIVANNPAVSRYLYDLQYGNKVVTEGAGRRRKGGPAQSEEELE